MDSSTPADKKFVPRLSVGLVHWPCHNQNGEVVCTNVTNFDIHDIARSCRTFGVEQYFIINRIQEQLMFVARVLDHWRVGEGSDHNRMRKTAISMIKLSETVEGSLKEFQEKPLIIATSAQNRSEFPNISFGQLREQLWCGHTSGSASASKDMAKPVQRPVYLLFGTGWGMTKDVLKICDYVLDPIRGSSVDDYRHLSVRSAAAICLDRLMGQ